MRRGGLRRDDRTARWIGDRGGSTFPVNGARGVRSRGGLADANETRATSRSWSMPREDRSPRRAHLRGRAGTDRARVRGARSGSPAGRGEGDEHSAHPMARSRWIAPSSSMPSHPCDGIRSGASRRVPKSEGGSGIAPRCDARGSSGLSPAASHASAGTWTLSKPTANSPQGQGVPEASKCKPLADIGLSAWARWRVATSGCGSDKMARSGREVLARFQPADGRFLAARNQSVSSVRTR